MKQVDSIDIISAREEIFQLISIGCTVSELSEILNINQNTLVFVAMEVSIDTKLSLKNELSNYFH